MCWDLDFTSIQKPCSLSWMVIIVLAVRLQGFNIGQLAHICNSVVTRKLIFTLYYSEFDLVNSHQPVLFKQWFKFNLNILQYLTFVTMKSTQIVTCCLCVYHVHFSCISVHTSLNNIYSRVFSLSLFIEIPERLHSEQYKKTRQPFHLSFHLATHITFSLWFHVSSDTKFLFVMYPTVVWLLVL